MYSCIKAVSHSAISLTTLIERISSLLVLKSSPYSQNSTVFLRNFVEIPLMVKNLKELVVTKSSRLLLSRTSTSSIIRFRGYSIPLFISLVWPTKNVKISDWPKARAKLFLISWYFSLRISFQLNENWNA